jgi:signal transduction histidine kinase
VLINGIIVTDKNSVLPANLRKEYRAQRVEWSALLVWHSQTMPRILGALADAATLAAKQAIDGLHDIKTTVSLVMRNAEAIADQFDGQSDDERIENAPEDMKSLLKSVKLLNSVLAMTSILANADAATFGQRHPMPVYKVYHRMVRLFEQAAARRGIEIGMRGSSFQKPPCFDSFEVIALVLLDNAIKYSRPNGNVEVQVDDFADGGVHVAVRSIGPQVPPGEEEAIFGRGVRTERAKMHASRGSGLGLFIAEIVARAHGFDIRYQRGQVLSENGDGWNTFEFAIPG